MKDFVKKKFEWLVAVAADQRLTKISQGVAIMLVAKYVNYETGLAWPSIATLAADLNVHWSSVQRALKQLAEYHYLQLEKQQKQDTRRKHRPSNVWRLNLGIASVLYSMDAQNVSHRRYGGYSTGAIKGDSTGAILTRERTREGTRERTPAAPPSHSDPLFDEFGRRKRTKQKSSTSAKKETNPTKKEETTSAPKTRWPDGWVCGDPELADAAKIAPDWTGDKILAEFDRFHDYCLDRSYQSHDWPARWRKWCADGKQYESKQPKKGLSKMESIMLGLQRGRAIIDRDKTKH